MAEVTDNGYTIVLTSAEYQRLKELLDKVKDDDKMSLHDRDFAAGLLGRFV